MPNLNHVHLHVLSVDRARDFYARHFGLRPHADHGGILFMRDHAGMDLALRPADRLDEFSALVPHRLPPRLGR
jgi:catechol 2,3-dioxygenase-like lactoylglutathione lyase family enzyme